MFLIIIYEEKRILAGVVINEGHELYEFKNMAQLRSYVKEHPINTVIGVSKSENSKDKFKIYLLKSIRSLDVQLLKSTVQAVLGDKAKVVRFTGSKIIYHAFEGSSKGNSALNSIYKKNIKHDEGNKQYDGFSFIASEGDLMLREVITYVSSM